MKRKWILALALMPAAAPANALNYMDVCAKALTYTEVSSSNDLAVKLAFLKVKLESLRKENNTNASVDVPGYGSMDYNKLDTEARRLEEKLDLNWSVQQSQGYLAKYVSTDSNSTFGNCVKQVLQYKAPISIEVKDANDQQVVLKVYVGPNATAQNALELDLHSNGTFAAGVQRKWNNAGGDATAIIRRANPGIYLNVVARVRSNGLQLGDDSFTMPAVITISQSRSESKRTSEVSKASCGGVRGGPAEGSGNLVTIYAGENERLDPSRLEIEVLMNRGDPPREWQVMSGEEAIRVDFVNRSDRAITAKAWCRMWADEVFHYHIRVKAPVIKTSVNALQQPDNGTGKVMTRAPDNAP